MKQIVMERFIHKSEERLYFTIPFEVPVGIERLDIEYHYPRYLQTSEGTATFREEINIIDLALNAPNGEYVGASGSDRSRICISAAHSAQGYTRVPIHAGTWEIIVGAYKIADEGVTVKYTVTMAEKTLRRWQGDIHTHTTASDGTLSSEQLIELCRWQHLDFLFVTNHNNFSENFSLPHPEDLTVIPGTEWTHYNGHANFLGVERPYRNPFCVNTPDQARSVMEEARNAGATIVINHPFCKPECGWVWGMDLSAYDAVEVWNGPLMHENENTACLAWWHDQLLSGRHIPITGGSDFHRTGLMTLPGIPCTCLFAPSREPDDLLQALKCGHGYIKIGPDGPDLEVYAGEAILGDTVPPDTAVKVKWSRLRPGDTLRMITDRRMESLVCPPNAIEMETVFCPKKDHFVRFEIRRSLLRNLEPICVLVSNPVYFDIGIEAQP